MYSNTMDPREQQEQEVSADLQNSDAGEESNEEMDETTDDDMDEDDDENDSFTEEEK